MRLSRQLPSLRDAERNAGADSGETVPYNAARAAPSPPLGAPLATRHLSKLVDWATGVDKREGRWASFRAAPPMQQQPRDDTSAEATMGMAE